MAMLYKQNAGRRTLIVWLTFMVVQWAVFGLGLLSHPNAYSGAGSAVHTRGGDVFLFITGSNALLLGLIAVGNIFVRFGALTPGLLILAYEAVVIGWTAGTNAFMEPFASVAAANAAFLRIGLWETTAYAVVCALTMTKSLYVADSFPAKSWIETHRLKDLRLGRDEKLLLLAGLGCLLGAALVEAFWAG